MLEDYRVNLDVYNGPLDLLLYLIRREEVDIYDIPIARVTEQYLQYVDVIRSLDPDLAGEFMVMAATLMEIKTRMLLPALQLGEDGEGIQIDPRAELIRQLLRYKAIKDAAADLEDAAALQALKFARAPVKSDGDNDLGVDLEDAQIWDLFDAFSRIMEAIGHRATHHQVIYDDTPLELHAADILDRLSREGQTTFERIFEGRTVRGEIIGLFLAILELIRRRKVIYRQERNFGEIYLGLNPDPPAEAANGEAERSAGPAEPQVEARPGSAGGQVTISPEPPGPTQGQSAGTYVSDTPAISDPDDEDDLSDEDNDDAGAETTGIGT